MSKLSMLWITTGGDGAGLARRTSQDTPVICWGEQFDMSATDALTPAHKQWDRVVNWHKNHKGVDDGSCLMVDGYEPFAHQRNIDKAIIRSTSDFQADIGCAKDAKMTRGIAAHGRDFRNVLNAASALGCDSIPYSIIDVLEEALLFLEEYEGPVAIGAASQIEVFPNSKSARYWLEQITNFGPINMPVIIAPLSSGIECRVGAWYARGERVSKPLLDIGGSVVAIDEASPVFNNTMGRMVDFIKELGWTGYVALRVYIPKDGKGQKDKPVYMLSIMPELRHAHMPAMLELFKGSISQFWTHLMEGNNIKWREGWGCQRQIYMITNSALYPIWAEKGLQQDANIWWCDVVKDSVRHGEFFHVGGFHPATVSTYADKDPRKANMSLEYATEHIICPGADMGLNVIPNAFKKFSALTNWGYCTSIQHKRKKGLMKDESNNGVHKGRGVPDSSVSVSDVLSTNGVPAAV